MQTVSIAVSDPVLKMRVLPVGLRPKSAGTPLRGKQSTGGRRDHGPVERLDAYTTRCGPAFAVLADADTSTADCLAGGQKLS